MTQLGELLTQNGALKLDLENVFSFNKSFTASYDLDVQDRSKVEIKMRHPNEQQHNTFQMIFVLKGSLSFKRHGGAIGYGQIGAYQHNLCRVSLASTSMVMSNFEDEVFCINLNESFLKRHLPSHHPASQQLSLEMEPESPVLLSPFNLPITPEITAILKRLGNLSNSGISDQLMMESKVIELLSLQILQFEALQSGAVNPTLHAEETKRMHKAKEILIHHTGKQLSLRELAHLVCTNEFNLKRDFKVAFGDTVYGYLKQYKMDQAKTMLSETKLSISEIAKKAGYKHTTHFSSAFKKYFGYLPNKIKSGKLFLLVLIQDFSMIFESLGVLI